MNHAHGLNRQRFRLFREGAVFRTALQHRQCTQNHKNQRSAHQHLEQPASFSGGLTVVLRRHFNSVLLDRLPSRIWHAFSTTQGITGAVPVSRALLRSRCP